jgi:hypothetical protein
LHNPGELKVDEEEEESEESDVILPTLRTKV